MKLAWERTPCVTVGESTSTERLKPALLKRCELSRFLLGPLLSVCAALLLAGCLDTGRGGITDRPPLDGPCCDWGGVYSVVERYQCRPDQSLSFDGTKVMCRCVRSDGGAP